ncbi:hypothetical protein cyc_05509 [Cyclospora cayetanensis]|uniref:Uncharacterized protein n=1 Tax=Cyclospora cayetanensis TaxID=88456 RepID=A0A1D3D1P9_9EIME|nr:hypothetical protein cyc_05509 [Cyclospora cayetanensis]
MRKRRLASIPRDYVLAGLQGGPDEQKTEMGKKRGRAGCFPSIPMHSPGIRGLAVALWGLLNGRTLAPAAALLVVGFSETLAAATANVEGSRVAQEGSRSTQQGEHASHTSAPPSREGGEIPLDEERKWRVRWADEEGKPLYEIFDSNTKPESNTALQSSKGPSRGILVRPSPEPQSIDWQEPFKIWDFDENPWTPTEDMLEGSVSTLDAIQEAVLPKSIENLQYFPSNIHGLIKLLEAQQEAFERWHAEKVFSQRDAHSGEPVWIHEGRRESAEDSRLFLRAVEKVQSAIDKLPQGGTLDLVLEKARHLFVYGLLVQHKQELHLDAARNQTIVDRISRNNELVAPLLAMHRQEIQESIRNYLEAMREAQSLEIDSAVASPEVLENFESFLTTISLEKLNALAEALHHPTHSANPMRLVVSITSQLNAIGAVLPKLATPEASLQSRFSEMQASNLPELLVLASTLGHAFSRISSERDKLVQVLVAAAEEFALATREAAVEQSKAQKYEDAITNRLEAIRAMRPLIDKARELALQGVRLVMKEEVPIGILSALRIENELLWARYSISCKL